MKDDRMTKTALVSVLGAVLAAALFAGSSAAEKAVTIPAPKIDQTPENRREVAVLAGGCFWGMEAVFEHVKGVESVVSGYAGGTAETANYEDVSSETTRHAEAIRIVYNPAKVTYGTLLRVYFSVAHDPTQLNRQGPDTGPSYRSAIFPQTPDQGRIARGYMAQLTAARSWPRPIVTRIEAGKFYPAESYHQDFMRKNPAHPYILRWDRPKLAAYKAAFPQLAR
jgi:peptide-methionine (S)-S-oxide reductase